MKQLILLLTLSSSFTILAQSPWTKKKKEAYLQLSYTTITGYSELFGNPTYNTERKINDNTIQFYSEYGITDKTTLVVNLPLKMVSSNDLTANNSSPITTDDSKIAFGNIQLGLKHNFIHKKWLLTGQINIEANTGSFEKDSGLRTGYNAWTITPLIITGTTFNKWYLQTFTGIDIRTNDYSSSFKLGGEIGYKTLNWLWISGFLDGVASFHDGELQQSTSNILTGLYVNNQSFAGYGLKFIGEFNKKTGATLGLGGAFGGRNVAKKPAITFGIYHKI